MYLLGFKIRLISHLGFSPISFNFKSKTVHLSQLTGYQNLLIKIFADRDTLQDTLRLKLRKCLCLSSKSNLKTVRCCLILREHSRDKNIHVINLSLFSLKINVRRDDPSICYVFCLIFYSAQAFMRNEHESLKSTFIQLLDETKSYSNILIIQWQIPRALGTSYLAR